MFYELKVEKIFWLDCRFATFGRDLACGVVGNQGRGVVFSVEWHVFFAFKGGKTYEKKAELEVICSWLLGSERQGLLYAAFFHDGFIAVAGFKDVVCTVPVCRGY